MAAALNWLTGFHRGQVQVGLLVGPSRGLLVQGLEVLPQGGELSWAEGGKESPPFFQPRPPHPSSVDRHGHEHVSFKDASECFAVHKSTMAASHYQGLVLYLDSQLMGLICAFIEKQIKKIKRTALRLSNYTLFYIIT